MNNFQFLLPPSCHSVTLLLNPNNRTGLNSQVLPEPVKSNPPLISSRSKWDVTGRNPSSQRLMQTFGSHFLIIRFMTHSLIVNFTEPASVHLNHLMTLADSSLLSDDNRMWQQRSE